MAHVARFVKQRRVRRGAMKARYTKQKRNWRDSTKVNVPTLASIAPTTAVQGTAPFTLTCTGTNYVAGVTKVTLNGGVYPTTFVSATSVTTQITPPATAMTVQVNVQNGALASTTPKPLTITATAGTQSGPFNVGEHTIAETQTYVDDHPDEADEILAAEQASASPRVTLIDWLQGFISHRDEGTIP